MLKLPFFNRHRYVVLKCYTNNERIHELAPMTLSAKLEPPKADVGNAVSFKSCYGHITGLNRSVTLPMWSETKVVSGLGDNKDQCGYMMNLHRPFSDIEPVDFNHKNDPTYYTPQCHITKIISPWNVEEETGVKWVVASHIRNTTPMSIPSGFNNYKYDHFTHIFNLVHRHPHEYTIPFKTPVLALYPITDLPLHVETYFDAAKCEALNNKASHKPYRRGNMLKISRDSS